MAYNRYIKELYTIMERRYAPDSDDMTTTRWLEKNTKLKGRAFTTDKYPYQPAILDDDHQTSVVIKPSQTGISEIYQRKMLAFLTRNRNTTGIYSYPDDIMRKRNSQTRVDPLVEGNKVFNLETMGGKPVRSIDVMQIGTSFMYMTGSKVGDATSLAADVVYLDELDLHDQTTAALFSSRLQNSEFKIHRSFSTPTFTEFGIDSLFNGSDQRYFMVRCDSCNHWQFPLFTPAFIEIPNLPSDINDLLEIDQAMIDTYALGIENSYVCCERCRSPLDLGRESNRSWVAKYPARTVTRGFKINPFSTSTRPPKDIIKDLLDYKKKDFIRGFKNSVLGEAEDSSSARISDEDIRACMARGNGSEVPAPRRDTPAWVGIDMGHTCHIVVGLGYTVAKQEVVRMFSCPIALLLEKIKEIDENYTVIGGMVDRHPESQAAANVRDMTHGRIQPCEYRGSKELNLVKGPDGEVIHCQADRTTLLDEVDKAIRNRRISLSGYGVHKSDVISHLRNMVRVEEPEVPADWKKLDSNDHFFHALGFMLAAVKMHKLQDLESKNQQTVIGIQGVSTPGVNEGLLGRKANTYYTPSSGIYSSGIYLGL